MTTTSNPDRVPSYHPLTTGVLERIGNARYPSELSVRKIMVEAGKARLPETDIDAIAKAVAVRRGQLIISHDVEPPVDMPESAGPLTAEEPWSPTQGMTDAGVEREPDWRERQIPNGDR